MDGPRNPLGDAILKMPGSQHRVEGRLSLLEVEPGGGLATTPLMALPESAAASVTARARNDWTWAVELVFGRLVSRGEIELRAPRRPPVHPLQILTSQDLFYLLTADPGRGPKLDEPPVGRNRRLR